MKSHSRVRLLATPWTAAHQTPPSMGFSRRVLESVAIAFSVRRSRLTFGATVYDVYFATNLPDCRQVPFNSRGCTADRTPTSQVPERQLTCCPFFFLPCDLWRKQSRVCVCLGPCDLFFLIYFWLCWVFIAADGLSLVAANRG